MQSRSSSERPILVFDSGVGGLPYLETARRYLPGERFLYLADRAGFPYGTKSHEEVRDRVVWLVGAIVRLCDPKAIVIACNTASQAALSAARKAKPGLPIVGTVPAVKPAALRSRTGTIAVLATEGTVHDPYLDQLEAQFAQGVRLLRQAAQPLVAFVEEKSIHASPEARQAMVAPFVKGLVEAGADEIVLACTHFLHLREDIAKVAGSGVEVVDSREGVSKRLRQVLTDCGLICEASDSATLPPVQFFLTGKEAPEAVYGDFAQAFGLAGPFLLGESAQS